MGNPGAWGGGRSSMRLLVNLEAGVLRDGEYVE